MPEFIFRYDAIPETWQFLNGMRRDDLVAELIQNELDAGSIHTRIHFGEEAMWCEGNGVPVDEDGWSRLSYFRGAGDAAPRKRAKTGVKNHGLKACFTIGDDIIIRSDGKYIQQTLCDPRFKPTPRPGVMEQPQPDSSAPRSGCRVEVPYRTENLQINAGEPLTFPAISHNEIADLFEAACAEAPQRFIGVVRPGLRPHYRLELSHWQLGRQSFQFAVIAKRKRAKEGFSRSCSRISGSSPPELVLREQACALTLPSKLAGAREIPEFYQSRNGLMIEISWQVDSRGRLVFEQGQLRYPIAYAGRGPTSTTGVFASYSAPFISDTERHGISQQGFNAELMEQCDEALVTILRDTLLPRHGPKALSMVSGEQIDPDRRREFLKLILSRGAVPISPTRPRSKKVSLVSPSQKRSSKWAFAIPSFTWSRGEVSPTLAALCPSNCHTIHSDTPFTIVEDLAEDIYEDRALGNNQTSPYTVFDESDVTGLIERDAAASIDFPWSENWATQLPPLEHSLLVCDVLVQTEKRQRLDDAHFNTVRDCLALADDQGILTPIEQLFSTQETFDRPRGFPGPAILHKKLRKHPLFRITRWKRQPYGLKQFLAGADLGSKTESTKSSFWNWAKTHWQDFRDNIRRAIATLPIWPTLDGQRVPLAETCHPSDRQIRAICRSVIRVPKNEVLRMKGIRTGGRGALAIRSNLSDDEIARWFQQRISEFRAGQKLDATELAKFKEFEADVAVLARDRAIAAALRGLNSQAFAQDQKGILRLCEDLHRENAQIRFLELRAEDLIRRSPRVIDEVFEPRTSPSFAALQRALHLPPSNTNCWLARLAAYVKAAEREGNSPKITDQECVRLGDSWRNPNDLALKTKSSEYWGSWKSSILVADISAAEQSVLRAVGVAPAEPDQEYSIAFFQWLAKQSASQIAAHLPQIVRHFEHLRSVVSWWTSRPEVSCLPVRNGDEVLLVSYSEATERMSFTVSINDFPALAEKMGEDGSDVYLVYGRIVEHLTGHPIARLSHIAGDPIRVVGLDQVEASPECQKAFAILRSSKFARELRHRLALWDIPIDLLRGDWRKRLSAFRYVAFCNEITISYRVAGREYEISSVSGFDAASETLLIVDPGGGEVDALFEAAAAHILNVNAPKMAKAAFGRVARSALPRMDAIAEIGADLDSADEPSGEDWATDDDASDDIPEEGDARDDIPEEEDSENIGESRETHGMRGSRNRNLPLPQDLSTNGSSAGNRQRPSGIPPRSHSARPISELEDRHKQQLKEIYAWHCQICLATKTPLELAPVGTYAFEFENRRCLIQAHHPDQFHAGGARHGGNLIVVCQAHHDLIGDRIARQRFTTALQADPAKREVSFFTDSGEVVTLPGVVVEILIATTGETLPFFFANQHLEYWLKAHEVTL